MILASNEILKSYIPLVDFIAGIVGPFCEVVLHDITNVESSIIAIKNSHISGRKVGGPLTDLGIKLINDKEYLTKDYLLNYSAKTVDGKILRSSTFFIKDPDGKLIGMLCINVDLTEALNAREFLNSFIMDNGKDENKNDNEAEKKKKRKKVKNGIEISEYLTVSLEDLMQTMIKNAISEVDIPPERMSPEEKMRIVQKLNEKGVFLIKGAVTEVAKNLKTSENTIYRYLNKLE